MCFKLYLNNWNVLKWFVLFLVSTVLFLLPNVCLRLLPPTPFAFCFNYLPRVLVESKVARKLFQIAQKKHFHFFKGQILHFEKKGLVLGQIDITTLSALFLKLCFVFGIELGRRQASASKVFSHLFQIFVIRSMERKSCNNNSECISSSSMAF